MASYTVIQDIEAEDKLLGPLSLRQFIYAVIVVAIGFVMWLLVRVNFLLVIPLIPPAILFAVLAAPFGHDQSSEIWLLAKIRFILKPRLRLWNQSGLQELVTITAPKKVVENRTDGLDQTQVKSRLQALANTIDTRGWALKGADANMSPYNPQGSTERLISPQLPATQNVGVTLQAQDDMLDMKNNPVAQHMEQLVQAKDQEHREALMNSMNEARTQNTNPTGSPTMASIMGGQGPITNPQVAPQPQPAPVPGTEMAMPHLTNRTASYGNTHVLQPASVAAKPAPVQSVAQNATTPVPAAPKPAILKLASNDDLSVATIARQANKASGNDEVVISLR